MGDLSSLSSWTAEQFDPALSWADVEWVKKRWGGKLILKGSMDAEDARLAADSGADALIVSNHGGRQLDGAPSSIAALPAIADAVGERIEVWMDGGIRSGQDVLKAWALGARGTLIGRSFLYGLGAMGEAGVTRCLEIIRNELEPDHGVLRAYRTAHGGPRNSAARQPVTHCVTRWATPAKRLLGTRQLSAGGGAPSSQSHPDRPAAARLFGGSGTALVSTTLSRPMQA